MRDKLFRVEFYVDDRKLGDALRALAGVAEHPGPNVQPVVNAVATKNGLLAKTKGGTALEQLMHWATTQHKSVILPSEVRAFLKSVGLSAGSVSYVLQEGVKAKALKRNGVGIHSNYTVLTR